MYVRTHTHHSFLYRKIKRESLIYIQDTYRITHAYVLIKSKVAGERTYARISEEILFNFFPNEILLIITFFSVESPRAKDTSRIYRRMYVYTHITFQRNISARVSFSISKNVLTCQLCTRKNNFSLMELSFEKKNIYKFTNFSYCYIIKFIYLFRLKIQLRFLIWF